MKMKIGLIFTVCQSESKLYAKWK